MEGILASILSSIVSGAVVSAVAGFLFKRWMDRVDERLSRIEQDAKTCTIGFISSYRTKAESEQDWNEYRRDKDESWKAITDLRNRMMRIETICERQHPA